MVDFVLYRSLCNVILRSVRVTIINVEKQYVLNILSGWSV